MIDHVALLVPHLEEARDRLRAYGLTGGEIESYPAEGTRELYLGPPGRPARLLLMQPLGTDGPYARALAKRGPGLHHVALRVPALESFLEASRGWLLHPRSLVSVAQSRTAWLARPGVGTLLEIQEQSEPVVGQPVVERIEVPTPADLPTLVPELGGVLLTALVPSRDGVARLHIGERSVAVSALSLI